MGADVWPLVQWPAQPRFLEMVVTTANAPGTGISSDKW